jgi:PKD repeat protein
LTILICCSSLLTSCSKPTEVCFTYAPTIVTTNTKVTFDASCSDNASYFLWSFGDNTADTTTTSLTITHMFSSEGQYNVTLQVKRKDGVAFGKDKPATTQIITVQ